ncbi:hypothetical protein R50072_19920 [Simiduia litorea]
MRRQAATLKRSVSPSANRENTLNDQSQQSLLKLRIQQLTDIAGWDVGRSLGRQPTAQRDWAQCAASAIDAHFFTYTIRH